MGGNNRKTVAEILRDKTFRADRHADRLAASQLHAPKEPPIRPKSLTGEARKMWELIVPELAGIVGPRDTATLVLLCTSYAQWLKAAKALDKLEPGTTEHSRLARTLKGLFETYEKLAAKFGLDPLSRERLPAVKTATEEDIEDLKNRAKFFNDDEARRELVRLGIETQVAPTKSKSPV